MLIALIINVSTSYLISGATYHRNFQHFALAMTCSKLVAMALIAIWTSVVTLEPWSAVLMSTGAFIVGFCVVKFILVVCIMAQFRKPSA